MNTTREGTTIIYENGLPVEINNAFIDALIKAKPGVYNRTAPKPSKDNLKDAVQDSTSIPPKPNTIDTSKAAEKPVDAVKGTIEPVKPVVPDKPADHTKDGKFTVEDLMQLSYKDLQETAKKLNASQNAKIDVKESKELLAKHIFKATEKESQK